MLQTDHTAQFYQNDVDSTIDGMLGHLSVVHPFDCQTSIQMINKLQQYGINTNYALDIGAGIGRVSHYVLHQKFKHVDMIEQCSKFIEQSKHNFAANSIDNRYCCSLQDIDKLNNISQKYDLVWIQWVIGHVTDKVLINFLKWCKNVTNYIVIKDNIIDQSFLFDTEDYNIIRSDIRMRYIIEQAGWKILIDEKIKGWEKFNLTDIKFIVLTQ